MEYRRSNPGLNSIFKKLGLKLGNFLINRIIESSLNQLSILIYQVKSSKETSKSSLSQAIVFGKELIHSFLHYFLHFLHMITNFLVKHVSDNLICANA